VLLWIASWSSDAGHLAHPARCRDKDSPETPIGAPPSIRFGGRSAF